METTTLLAIVIGINLLNSLIQSEGGDGMVNSFVTFIIICVIAAFIQRTFMLSARNPTLLLILTPIGAALASALILSIIVEKKGGLRNLKRSKEHGLKRYLLVGWVAPIIMTCSTGIFSILLLENSKEFMEKVTGAGIIFHAIGILAGALTGLILEFKKPKSKD